MRLTFEVWEQTAGEDQAQRADRLWRMRAYRLALYLSDMVWEDGLTLKREALTEQAGIQLVTAVGSIRANLAEGYSRAAGRERARFFEYSLGSAREAREWYAHSRRALDEGVVTERLSVLDEISRLLLAIIPRERTRTIRKA